MSTDRPKDKRVYQTSTRSEVKPSTRIKPLARIAFSPEIEISDETLEAVAGGGGVSLSPDTELNPDKLE